MSSGGDFGAKLHELTEYVERINDDPVDTIEGETGDGQPIQGYQCQHGGHIYLLMGSPEWEHFQLRYTINVDEAVALRYIVDDPSSVDEHVMRQARDRLEKELEGKPPREKKELRLNLTQILSREACIVEFDTTSPFNIHGFNLDKRIYPYEDDFQLSDFHYAVQTIINLGWVGKDFLLENYGLLGDS